VKRCSTFPCKIWVFWRALSSEIKWCSPLKVNRCFGGTCSLHLQGRRIISERNQHESRWQAETPKRQLTFNGLHGIISQKTELFIITAVRTSNPAYGYSVWVIFLEYHATIIFLHSMSCYMMVWWCTPIKALAIEIDLNFVPIWSHEACYFFKEVS
jgi:hypothetical protein